MPGGLHKTEIGHHNLWLSQLGSFFPRPLPVLVLMRSVTPKCFHKTLQSPWAPGVSHVASFSP